MISALTSAVNRQVTNLALLLEVDHRLVEKAVTALISTWRIPPEKQEASIDFLYRTTSATGYPLLHLMAVLCSAHGRLRDLGLEQAAVVTAKMGLVLKFDTPPIELDTDGPLEVALQPALAQHLAGRRLFRNLVTQPWHYDPVVTLQAVETHFRAAVEACPNSPNCWHNLASILQRKGDLQGAIECYSKAIRFDPDNKLRLLYLSRPLLQSGDWQRGLEYNEYRYIPDPDAPVKVPQPIFPAERRWVNRSIPAGQKILVDAGPDQGLGDHLNFARFIPLIKDRFHTRAVYAHLPRLSTVIHRLANVDEIVSSPSRWPGRAAACSAMM